MPFETSGGISNRQALRSLAPILPGRGITDASNEIFHQLVKEYM